MVNTVFKEPVQQLLEKIKHESFFKWPNKIAGDPLRRNQKLHCHYHQERGHTTEDCRILWNHLEQLVKEGKLKKFLYQPNRQGNQSGVANHGGPSSRPPLGTINVIFAAPRRTSLAPFRVMLVARTLAEESKDQPKRIKANILPVLGFSKEDKMGTIQPHEDALVVTLRIEDYDVKRISFEGKTVVPKGQIRLPVQSGPEVVNVDFIVVDAYSPYTAIVARPWLHALGAISSTLHVKVKFHSGDQVVELLGS
ncbi:uncharacterized protein LOC142633702 [Castanea sativa]|uniref:uncharacterized protein LOC142633702 n=1 Tax=Castanea sativa TaxID=21020 RepID=UPI003F65274D